MTERAKLELIIVLDTSALYTGSASDLLSRDAELIIKNNTHPELSISWVLPEIVLYERQFQMQRKNDDMLPTIRKLEKILGYSLDITEDVIRQKIKETLDVQIKNFNIQVVALDASTVNWKSLMFQAVFRQPPFDPGDKEKGFRDSLVIETFFQLASQLNIDSDSRLLALVANDKLLAETVKHRAKETDNIRVVSTLDELQGLINTLLIAKQPHSRFTEAQLAHMQIDAKRFFFVEGDKETLYYKKSIRAEIEKKYSDELSTYPQTTVRRYNHNWYILPPRLDKVDKGKLYWVSRITVGAIATEYTEDIDSLYTGKSLQGFVPDPNVEVQVNWTDENIWGFEYPESFRIPKGEVAVSSGISVFLVVWSVSGVSYETFQNAEIEQIVFVENEWVFG